MKYYNAVYTNYTGTWPNVLARDITAPGDRLGTEFIAEGMNETWGWRQALMYMAGNLLPNGVAESSSASQLVTAMQRICGHPGEIVAWHGQADPATVGLRLLVCEGQTFVRSQYTALDTACYIGDGNNSNNQFDGYHHTSDVGGTINAVGGTYMTLPDLRGQFLRGYDPTAVIDPVGGSRVFPSDQTDAIKIHGHELRALIDGEYTDSTTITSGSTVGWEKKATAGVNRLQAKAVGGDILGATTSVESRPNNYNVKWCVRY